MTAGLSHLCDSDPTDDPGFSVCLAEQVRDERNRVSL